jgi:DNA mismatch endonuclease (patch repair protein)
MKSISAESRSKMMKSVRSKDTKPEMLVRRYLHSAGFRYRLHDNGLPGCPDLVFPARKKAIFVHGCFWHQHNICRHGHAPKKRTEYWLPKLGRNVARDELAQLKLTELGWTSIVIWECELDDLEEVGGRLERFLN